MADFEKARLEAEKIWEELCLTTPPLPIVEVAQSYGFKIVEVDFRDNPDVSGLLDLKSKTIYLNQNDTVQHKRFTIAHELGHWRLHLTVLEGDPDLGIYYRRPIGGETDEKEKEANCFAANLLVPLSQLESFLPSCSDAELVKIFAVSAQVIGYRKKYLARHLNHA